MHRNYTRQNVACVEMIARYPKKLIQNNTFNFFSLNSASFSKIKYIAAKYFSMFGPVNRPSRRRKIIKDPYSLTNDISTIFLEQGQVILMGIKKIINNIQQKLQLSILPNCVIFILFYYIIIFKICNFYFMHFIVLSFRQYFFFILNI